MSKTLFIGTLAIALAACSGGEAKEAAGGTGGTGGKSGAGTGAARTPAAPAARTLAAGTRINATIQDALSSRTNKPGETVHATVSGDISDARGNIVVPSGSSVLLSIVQLEPGSDQVRPEGRLVLKVNSITVHGESIGLEAGLDPIPHTMKGRGITTDEAARVAAGTAIGAGIGQVIGKNTKGTVIGGAVGAVAGGAVAVRYAYRDIIVAAGAPIVITLSQALSVTAR